MRGIRLKGEGGGIHKYTRSEVGRGIVSKSAICMCAVVVGRRRAVSRAVCRTVGLLLAR